MRYFRVSRLTEELLRAGARQKKCAFFIVLAKGDLLLVDDFWLTPLADPFKRDLLDVWHSYLDDPTLADAILDRLVHNAYKVFLKGKFMRRRKTACRRRQGLTATATRMKVHTPVHRTDEHRNYVPDIIGIACRVCRNTYPLVSAASQNKCSSAVPPFLIARTSAKAC